MHKLLKGSFIALFVAIAACDGSNPTVPLNTSPALGKGTGGGISTSGGSSASGGTRPGGSTTTSSTSGTSGSGTSGDSSITLLTATGTSSVNSPTSFYAVQGLDRQGELYYVDPSSGNTARKLLRLRVRAHTQITRPDGTLLAPGDSILITITLIDRLHLIAQFEPAGLRFSGSDPAVLTMWFGETDHDLNHDGIVNAADATITQTFSIFRQAYTGAPWTRIPSTVTAGVDDVVAAIPGFSNYVIAY